MDKGMAMNSFKRLTLLAALSVAAVPASAQVGLNKLGQSTMNFQLVSISARSSALGDAVYSSAVGSEAIFYNPAGLSEAKDKFDINFFATQWIAGISYQAGAVAWTMGDFGTIGLSALNVDYGEIHATQLVPASGNAQSAVPYIDAGDMTNIGGYSFGLSYGRAISQDFLIGGTVRYTGQNLGQSLLAGGLKNNNASLFVFDLGVKYYTGLKSFRFGMAFRNFSSQIKREEVYEQLPTTFTISTAMDLFDVINPEHEKSTSLTLGADYLHSNNYTERVNLGLEYLMMDAIALRGGYQTNHDLQSWSLGMGAFVKVDTYDVQVSYSYSAMEYFDGVNRFSIGVGF